MAKQHGSPRADEIEQLVAVSVIEILAESAFDDQRLATNRAEGADGRVDTADENLLGFSEYFARAAIVAARRCLGNTHFLFMLLAPGIQSMVGR